MVIRPISLVGRLFALGRLGSAIAVFRSFRIKFMTSSLLDFVIVLLSTTSRGLSSSGIFWKIVARS